MTVLEFAATDSHSFVPVDEIGPAARSSAAAPIVAAVDGSTASRAAIATAVRVAAEMHTQLVFVYVRGNVARFLGAPFYQRRITATSARARRVLDNARGVAPRAGGAAEAEILEGSPRTRIVEFARDRGARLVVVGRRRRHFRSVSCAVVRTAAQPVLVARSDTRVLGQE